MKVIGFTNQYYTLWNRDEIVVQNHHNYTLETTQNYTYCQNLSMNFEEAKIKLEGQEYIVDLELRGSSSFSRTISVIDNAPEDIFAFGKYRGEKIEEVNDVNYTLWYYSQRPNDFIKNYLVNNGCVEYNGTMMDKEWYERIKYIDSLVSGHHFEDKKRVDLEIKELNSISFESFYGVTYICFYGSKCGKSLKYMGSNPPQIGNKFVKVKCTIKHDEYKGEPETKLQRIKLI